MLQRQDTVRVYLRSLINGTVWMNLLPYSKIHLKVMIPLKTGWLGVQPSLAYPRNVRRVPSYVKMVCWHYRPWVTVL